MVYLIMVIWLIPHFGLLCKVNLVRKKGEAGVKRGREGEREREREGEGGREKRNENGQMYTIIILYLMEVSRLPLLGLYLRERQRLHRHKLEVWGMRKFMSKRNNHQINTTILLISQYDNKFSF
jgi:hypothetical protein